MRNYAFILIAAGGLAVSMQALATSSSATGGSTGGNVTLTQMPLKGYPTPEEILKIEEENRKKQEEKGIPNPFEAQVIKEPEEPKPNVKQVYHGTSDVQMRRVIADPRIDDGYVQGLIQQRAR